MSEATEPIGSRDELIDYFRAGEKPASQWRVGTEHEKIGIYSDTGDRVPYAGDRGIGALLGRIAQADGWEPVEEGGSPIALRKDGASITLEPGGQLELSGAPLATSRDTCREFTRHVELVKRESAALGITWLALGVDPIHPVSTIPRMPKGRYAIMSDYLPTRGGHALDMMHATATVQANFDFCDETDMIQKMRTAMGCTAITSAIFSNSPISEGRPNGFVSKRVRIWRDVDPDRCGFLPFVFDPDFGYAQYAEWALDVPMFFVVRDHEYKPAAGMTFRQFYEKGFEGTRATLGDWDLHLTTVFPEIRLKRYIEVRGTDCVPPDLICAVPALWKGLLYDAEACNAAWELVCGWGDADREDGLDTASAHGLGGSVAGRSMLAWAQDLVAIARDGLGRLATPEAGDERSFLDPIDEVLARGQSPGEVLLARWNGDWAGSMDRLIDYARY